MRYYLCFLVCMYSVILVPQEIPEDLNIDLLKQQISESKGLQKLILLDSLSHNLRISSKHNYENISRQTIELAIELDSLKMASKHLADLMFYKNNITSIPQDGITIYNEYIPKLANLQSPKWDSELHIELADSYFFSGNIDSAFIYYDKAKTYAIEKDDEEFLAYVNLCMGSVYSSIGAFSEGSQGLKDAYQTFLKVKDTFGLIHSKYLLANIYSKNDFLKEAKIERQEGIRIALLVEDNGKLSSFYSDAAKDFKKMGLEKERIAHLKTALYYSEISEFDVGLRIGKLTSLSIAYSQNDSLQKAKEIITRIKNSPEWLNKSNSVSYLNAVQHLVFSQGNYSEALKYGKEILAIYRAKESYEQIKDSELFLSNIYHKLGDKEKALSHYKSYNHIKDSIAGIQKTRALAYYQTLYETEKRDQEILVQKVNISSLQQESKIRNQWFIIISTLVILSFIIFYIRIRYKRKLDKRIAVEQLRTKISADLHDDVGSVLTGLAMQTELIARKVPEEYKAHLQKVSTLSRAAMLQMRDAVWSMDSRKDNWGALIDRIREFAGENLNSKNISYILDTKGIEGNQELPGAIRQSLYLITKEAIANILKHSTADNVAIDMSKNKDEIRLSIKDNGIVEKQGTAGLGISNIKKRIDDLNGVLKININKGYEINIKIPA